jgi:hypothetical protein
VITRFENPRGWHTSDVSFEWWYFTAIKYYERALALARQIKDPVSVKKWTRNINLAYARIRLSVDEAHPRIA